MISHRSEVCRRHRERNLTLTNSNPVNVLKCKLVGFSGLDMDRPCRGSRGYLRPATSCNPSCFKDELCLALAQRKANRRATGLEETCRALSRHVDNGGTWRERPRDCPLLLPEPRCKRCFWEAAEKTTACSSSSSSSSGKGAVVFDGGVMRFTSRVPTIRTRERQALSRMSEGSSSASSSVGSQLMRWQPPVA